MAHRTTVAIEARSQPWGDFNARNSRGAPCRQIGGHALGSPYHPGDDAIKRVDYLEKPHRRTEKVELVLTDALKRCRYFTNRYAVRIRRSRVKNMVRIVCGRTGYGSRRQERQLLRAWVLTQAGGKISVLSLRVGDSGHRR